jgi:hypothetical protein
MHEHRCKAAQTTLRTPFAAGEFAGALDRHLSQNRWVHHLIDQPDLQRLPRADIPPRQDQFESSRQSDQSWQTLRSTRARNKPQLNFRES